MPHLVHHQVTEKPSIEVSLVWGSGQLFLFRCDDILVVMCLCGAA